MRPLSVAVLIDLERGPFAGGHVKCWERFARAAAAQAELDLTLYVLGPRPATDALAPNVRFEALPPVLGTRRLGPLVGGVDASDLTPYHPGLAARLPRHDVWHLTHTMGFASTALRAVRSTPRPLVASVHTDVPSLTGTYVGQVLGRALPAPLARRPRVARGVDRTAAWARERARRRRYRILGACAHVMVSNAHDRAEVRSQLPGVRVSRLRRGLDLRVFRPEAGDRAGLAAELGVPAERALVLFVGRVDESKGAMLAARAVRRLVDRGVDAQLVVCGRGDDADRIGELLGPRASLLGPVRQEELARVYASADVLAFPSRSETVGNVVGEAMACGCAVALPAGASTTQWLAAPGRDGVVVGRDDVETWAAALAGLLRGSAGAVGRRARATAERRHPSWDDVLREDLLPVWEAAASRAPAWPSPHANAPALARPPLRPTTVTAASGVTTTR